MAKKRANLPTHLRVTRKRTYETLHVETFVNPEILGETRFEPAQIVLKKGQSASEEVSTYLHEAYHAMCHEENIKLTETQVLKLEKATVRMFRLNPELLLELYEFYKKK